MTSLACARCGVALVSACACPRDVRRHPAWLLAEEVVVTSVRPREDGRVATYRLDSEPPRAPAARAMARADEAD